jgi:hypothetical protein
MRPPPSFAAFANLRLAASLAEKFNATLIGLSALAVHPPFLIEGVAIQQATAADIVEIMATLTAKGDWFRNIAAMDHQRIEWRQVLDYPADALAREARGADLVVIGQTKGPETPLARSIRVKRF